VRGTQIWWHQAGSGARKDDMDNIYELPVNVVSASEPKMLISLNQKVRGMVKAVEFRFAQSVIPPADRQILSRHG